MEVINIGTFPLQNFSKEIEPFSSNETNTKRKKIKRGKISQVVDLSIQATEMECDISLLGIEWKKFIKDNYEPISSFVTIDQALSIDTIAQRFANTTGNVIPSMRQMKA